MNLINFLTNLQRAMGGSLALNGISNKHLIKGLSTSNAIILSLRHILTPNILETKETKTQLRRIAYMLAPVCSCGNIVLLQKPNIALYAIQVMRLCGFNLLYKSIAPQMHNYDN